MDKWEVKRVKLQAGYATVDVFKGSRRAKVTFSYGSHRMKITETNARGLDSPRIRKEELDSLKPEILRLIAVERLTR